MARLLLYATTSASISVFLLLPFCPPVETFFLASLKPSQRFCRYADSDVLLPSFTSTSLQALNKSGESTSGRKSGRLPPPNQALSSTLNKVGLPLKPISDLGYYGWKLPQIQQESSEQHEHNQELKASVLLKTSSLSNVTAQEIQKYTCLSMSPKVPCDLKRLNETLPRKLSSKRTVIKSLQVPNKYPYGQTYIVSLHAAQQKGVDLKQVHFLFGSYTLYHLAMGTLEDGEKSVVARVPGTDIVLVTRYKEYIEDYSSKGYQFERVILGEEKNENDEVQSLSLDSVVHLQLMRIGSCNVLLAGEADAMDSSTSNPIEIKLGGMKNRAIRVLFQMISSGSLYLINGILKFTKKYKKGRLIDIHLISLRDFATKKPRWKMGKVILSRISWLRKLTLNEKLQDGQVMEIVFNKKNDWLKLVPASSVSIEDLFPNKTVVRSLLGDKVCQSRL